ncbi:PAS/PAC sensor hybrid histidine kinase [Roseibium hamelinense]|uniref:histidine kinase n=2 Tax=Roseibium hamelinense TaxID=150831 RepID=A0A562SLU7_9HYPH|nr:PAS/PAC sensor hybrid histidine kinase [Roseibium hamelinense]
MPTLARMEELNHNKNQLDLMQAALDHLNQGFSVFDANLRLVAWNRGLWEMLDFPQELARRGTHLEAFLRVNAERGEYGPGDIEGKIQRRLRRAQEFEPHYFERVRPNGQVIAVNGSPLPMGGFVTTYSDITEQRRRQEKLERTVEERTRALRQSEDWLRLVTDNIPALIAYLGPGPVFRFANRRYAEWFGQSVMSIVGRSAEEVAGKDLYLELAPHISQAFKGQAVSYEYDRRTADGSTVYMRSTLIPDITNDGRTLGVFVLSLDATDQKRTEARLLQSQRMDAVGKLSGGLAHDFNNLLSILMGNILSLKRHGQEINPDILSKHMTPMLKATRRGADLTQRLLAFSRGAPVAPQLCRLDKLLSDVETLLAGSLPSSIDFQIREAASVSARIDPAQLETALVNLVFNARDAIGETGHIDVLLQRDTLSKSEAEAIGLRAGTYAAIKVSDDGVGMDEQTRLRIFEPFFTTKSFGTGSGLGLSMVYGFAKQSGGAVAISTFKSRGTEITLYLPFEETSSQQICVMGNKQSDISPVPTGNGELIMLVEDDQDVALTLAEQLKDLGYTTLLASDVEDARALAQDIPELRMVLSDIVMPGQTNGLSLARAIRQRRPELGIILMTGYADWGVLDPQSSDCGFPLLMKPFENSQLAILIHQTLNGSVS